MNRYEQHCPRAATSELLFVDPSVLDRDMILSWLRPEVEAIVLDAVRPPARQIAAVLDGRSGLDVVHVIAHGAPGRVSFAAGDWSADALVNEAEDHRRARTADAVRALSTENQRIVIDGLRLLAEASESVEAAERAAATPFSPEPDAVAEIVARRSGTLSHDTAAGVSPTAQVVSQ